MWISGSIQDCNSVHAEENPHFLECVVQCKGLKNGSAIWKCSLLCGYQYARHHENTLSHAGLHAVQVYWIHCFPKWASEILVMLLWYEYVAFATEDHLSQFFLGAVFVSWSNCIFSSSKHWSFVVSSMSNMLVTWLLEYTSEIRRFCAFVAVYLFFADSPFPSLWFSWWCLMQEVVQVKLRS